MKNTKNNLPLSKLCKNQKKAMRKNLPDGSVLIVELRYDDKCDNGHNTFSITGELYDRDYIRGEEFVTNDKGKKRYLGSCGCIHEEITKHFSELAHLIKWHGCTSEGPSYYIQNTVFFAGDKDCWGKRKGEPKNFEKQIRFYEKYFPIGFPVEEFVYYTAKLASDKFENFLSNNHPSKLEIVKIEHEENPKNYSPKYTFNNETNNEQYGKKWYECPFDTEREAEEWLEALNNYSFEFIQVPTSWGEGKERQLDAARNTAIWPEATDQDLIDDGLEERLLSRLPAIMDEFKGIIEGLDFTY